jgi:hypothetical protein
MPRIVTRRVGVVMMIVIATRVPIVIVIVIVIRLGQVLWGFC